MVLYFDKCMDPQIFDIEAGKMRLRSRVNTDRLGKKPSLSVSKNIMPSHLDRVTQ